MFSVGTSDCLFSFFVRGDIFTCALIAVISSLSCFRRKVPPAVREGVRYVTEGWHGISTVEFY